MITDHLLRYQVSHILSRVRLGTIPCFGSTTGDVESKEDDDGREDDWLRAKMQAHFHTLERPSAGMNRTHKTKCKWLLTGFARQRWVAKLHHICTIRYK